MLNRIVEISSDRIHVSLERGFLKLKKAGEEIGEVPLPDISAIIVRGYGATISLNLTSRLAALNIPVVLCGVNQTPDSIVWPLSGHHAQGFVMEGQFHLSKPLRKRIWKALIKTKIEAQARVIELLGQNGDHLSNMAKHVKSGDPDNLEAQAARHYWLSATKKIDHEFRRDRNRGGINAALNYGATILRAGAARAICSAGLHPSLSIHHKSRGEALRLTSDIMEPFRPWFDHQAIIIASQYGNTDFTLTSNDKLALTEVLSLDLETVHGASPLQTCLNRLCQSFADICLNKRTDLDLPAGPIFSAQTNMRGA